jgi:hypothetical protein
MFQNILINSEQDFENSQYLINTKLTEQAFVNGTPVYLNVYYKSSISEYIEYLGLGIYHTALEIFDVEFSFGYCEKDCGITANKSYDYDKQMKFKEKIYLGHCLYNLSQIKEIIFNISSFWKGNSYDPFTKNCNEFTKYLSSKIIHDPIRFPEYVNLIATQTTILKSFFKPIFLIVSI